jgi:hypothetical protein
VRLGELLGVFEPGIGEGGHVLGQDDGGGYDRAEESAAADLVDAGDGEEAAETEGLLVCVAADEELEHALLGGGGGDGRRGAGCTHSGYEFTTFVGGEFLMCGSILDEVRDLFCAAHGPAAQPGEISETQWRAGDAGARNFGPR